PLLVQDMGERRRRQPSTKFRCRRRKCHRCRGHLRISCLGWGWPASSNESAETRNGLSKDQVLHLKRAFVGVEGFAVRKEARDFVVGDDAVTAQELAGPC